MARRQPTDRQQRFARMPSHRKPSGARLYGARSLSTVCLLALLLNACQGLRNLGRGLPSTPLTFDAPIDWGTRGKIMALRDETPRCLALLDAAGVSHALLPPVRQDQCGYENGIRLERSRALPVAFHPDGLAVGCPVAVALTIWERQVVQPAAQRHLGKAVAGIDHYGSFACRRIGGRRLVFWLIALHFAIVRILLLCRRRIRVRPGKPERFRASFRRRRGAIVAPQAVPSGQDHFCQSTQLSFRIGAQILERVVFLRRFQRQNRARAPDFVSGSALE
jgi:hypothetical protein